MVMEAKDRQLEDEQPTIQAQRAATPHFLTMTGALRDKRETGGKRACQMLRIDLRVSASLELSTGTDPQRKVEMPCRWKRKVQLSEACS
jgi:hypothetical protein